MGLFGRKKDEGAAVTTTKMQGWMADCGPMCGFMVRDHDKKEAVQMTKMHMKQTHKTNLTDAEVEASLKPTTW